MTQDKKTNDKAAGASATGSGASDKDSPEWADGLRKLYDSVVEEPLPDSFMDLLSKLDKPTDGDTA